MNTLIKAVALTVALAAPLAAFAQADQGLTRDQVRAQLVEFQQTSRNQAVNTQVSEPVVTQGSASFGGVSNSSASGGRYVSEAARSGPQSVYFGGQ